MLDFLGNASSVIITAIIVAGFLAIAALAFTGTFAPLAHEVGAMILFWIRHSLSDSTGERFPGAPRPHRLSRLRRH